MSRMNCPTCNIQLKIADRQGVEVNYCPDCRGVWIDRGGLDRIIDRSGVEASVTRHRDADEEHPRDGRNDGPGGRRRKSLFSELFD